MAFLFLKVQHTDYRFIICRDSILGVDWYVAPLVNPDGYNYSMTTDRLWRKNR
jgi:hypothetical protein